MVVVIKQSAKENVCILSNNNWGWRYFDLDIEAEIKGYTWDRDNFLQEIKAEFEKIPPLTSELSLEKNSLGRLPVDSLIDFLSRLPDSIKSLDLSGNFLYELDEDALCRLLYAIPKSVVRLNLSSNLLHGDKKTIIKNALGPRNLLILIDNCRIGTVANANTSSLYFKMLTDSRLVGAGLVIGVLALTSVDSISYSTALTTTALGLFGLALSELFKQSNHPHGEAQDYPAFTTSLT